MLLPPLSPSTHGQEMKLSPWPWDLDLIERVSKIVKWKDSCDIEKLKDIVNFSLNKVKRIVPSGVV